jgi:hypothetical protein
MIYTHASHTALRPGDTLVLVGKLGRPVDGLLKVRARGADGRELSDSFAVKLAADRSDTRGRHAHLPRTWAREEIAALTANEGERAKSTIIELSTRLHRALPLHRPARARERRDVPRVQRRP